MRYSAVASKVIGSPLVKRSACSQSEPPPAKQAVADTARKINGGTVTTLNVVKNGVGLAATLGGGTIKRTKASVAGVVTRVSNGSAALADITKLGIIGTREKLTPWRINGGAQCRGE
jgi:hypothetical protein